MNYLYNWKKTQYTLFFFKQYWPENYFQLQKKITFQLSQTSSALVYIFLNIFFRLNAFHIGDVPYSNNHLHLFILEPSFYAQFHFILLIRQNSAEVSSSFFFFNWQTFLVEESDWSERLLLPRVNSSQYSSDWRVLIIESICS